MKLVALPKQINDSPPVKPELEEGVVGNGCRTRWKPSAQLLRNPLDIRDALGLLHQGVDQAVVLGTRRMPHRIAQTINDHVLAVERALEMDRSLEHMRNCISNLSVNVILTSPPAMKRATSISR